MGQMVLNMIGFGPYLGLNSAVETLVAQAYGADNMRLVGVYLQRGRLIAILAFFIMFTCFFLSNKALSAMGQNPEVVREAY